MLAEQSGEQFHLHSGRVLTQHKLVDSVDGVLALKACRKQCLSYEKLEPVSVSCIRKSKCVIALHHLVGNFYFD